MCAISGLHTYVGGTLCELRGFEPSLYLQPQWDTKRINGKLFPDVTDGIELKFRPEKSQS